MEGGQEEKSIIDEWSQWCHEARLWAIFALDGKGAVTQQHIKIQMEIKTRGHLYKK